MIKCSKAIYVFSLVIAFSFEMRPIRGDLVLTFQNSTFAAGSTGTLDVFVSSDSVDRFFSANYLFKIETISSTGGVLEFVELHSNQAQMDSTYVFYGFTDPDNFTYVRQDPDKQLLLGFDETANFSDIEVTSSDLLLLARLELQHITPTPETSSGTFRISLVENPDFTFFLSENDPINPFISPASYTNFGIVTITAVPEPTSLCLLGAGCFSLILRRRILKSMRRQKVASNT